MSHVSSLVEEECCVTCSLKKFPRDPPSPPIGITLGYNFVIIFLFVVVLVFDFVCCVFHFALIQVRHFGSSTDTVSYTHLRAHET